MPSQTKQGKQEEKKNSERAGQITHTKKKWQKTSECKTNIISEYKLNSSVRTQRLSEKIKKYRNQLHVYKRSKVHQTSNIKSTSNIKRLKTTECKER